jgi:hypothetical protein
MKAELNERQKEAVEYTQGPLLILAGAGAGKTKTIVERIINIIKKGTEPNQILAITFTNKAAKEMRERILHRLKEEGILDNTYYFANQNNIPTIKTFHSLGMQILQEEYLRAGLTKRLTIYDDSDTNSLIKDILEQENIDPKMHEPRLIEDAAVNVLFSEPIPFHLRSGRCLPAVPSSQKPGSPDVLRCQKFEIEVGKDRRTVRFGRICFLPSKLKFCQSGFERDLRPHRTTMSLENLNSVVERKQIT